MIPSVCTVKLITPLLAAWQFSGHPDGLALTQAADSFGVPREVMFAVAWAETRHNTSTATRSKAGARGRMQINPRVWRCRWWVSRHNLACGAAILYFYYRSSGNWSDAVYHYCGRGPAARRYRAAVEREMGRLQWKSWTEGPLRL